MRCDTATGRTRYTITPHPSRLPRRNNPSCVQYGATPCFHLRATLLCYVMVRHYGRFFSKIRAAISSSSQLMSLIIASFLSFRSISVLRVPVQQQSQKQRSADVGNNNTGLPRACRAAFLCTGTDFRFVSTVLAAFSSSSRNMYITTASFVSFRFVSFQSCAHPFSSTTTNCVPRMFHRTTPCFREYAEKLFYVMVRIFQRSLRQFWLRSLLRPGICP